MVHRESGEKEQHEQTVHGVLSTSESVFAKNWWAYSKGLLLEAIPALR